MGNCCSTEFAHPCQEIKSRTPRNGFRAAAVKEGSSRQDHNPFHINYDQRGYNQDPYGHPYDQHNHYNMVNNDLNDFNQVSKSHHFNASKSAITMSKLMTATDNKPLGNYTDFQSSTLAKSSLVHTDSKSATLESQLQAATLQSQTTAMLQTCHAVTVTIDEIPPCDYRPADGCGDSGGPFNVSDGGTYAGQVSDGMMCGRGKWVGPDGDYYYGYWKDNVREGQGRYISVKGDVYDGSWQAGSKSGKGLLQRLNGYLYRGEWLDDLPHGKGYEREADGAIYEGDFYKGARNGEGTYNDAKNVINYKGMFKDGVFEGQGIIG